MLLWMPSRRLKVVIAFPLDLRSPCKVFAAHIDHVLVEVAHGVIDLLEMPDLKHRDSLQGIRFGSAQAIVHSKGLILRLRSGCQTGVADLSPVPARRLVDVRLKVVSCKMQDLFDVHLHGLALALLELPQIGLPDLH